MDRFDHTDATKALTPSVNTVQFDDVEMSFVLDGISYFFRGDILVKMEEEYDSYLVGASGTFYIGDDDEDGLTVYWEETNTECFRLLEMTYEKDDVLKDIIAYKVRYA